MAIIQKTFPTANITVAASADTVQKKLCSLGGVRSAVVNLRSDTMTVEYDPELISEEKIVQTVRECGYGAYTGEIRVTEEETETVSASFSKKDLLLPALLILTGILTYLPVPGILPALSAAAAGFVSLRRSGNAFMQEIIEMHPSGSVLLTCAALFAYGYGIFRLVQDGSNPFFLHSAVIFFTGAVTAGLIEYSNSEQSRELQSIKGSLPATAAVYENRTESREAVADLKEDQIILIRPGDTIPADGVVIRGFAYVDESALTGWDEQAEKSEGSYVYANTVCLKGSIRMKAERVGDTTAMMRFAKIAEKTGTDSSFRSPFKSFGQYLFLYSVLAALICGGGWVFSGHSTDAAVTVALCVLSCTCLGALGLATGRSVMKTAQTAAKKHILFRSVESLELAGKADTAVIAQDGVMTERSWTVTDFIPAENQSAARFEYIAYALESRSDQPFARGITRYLKSRRLSKEDAAEISRLNARGRGAVNAASRFSSFAAEELPYRNVDSSMWDERLAELRKAGKRVMVFTETDEIIGVIAAVRPAVPGSADAVEALCASGTAVTVITDGTADASRLLHEKIPSADVLFDPADYERERFMQDLDTEDRITAYVSSADPGSLAEYADVCVTVGAGTQIDQNSEAGIVLTRNRLSDFLTAVRLSEELNEKVQKYQVMVILYHIAAIFLFGFVLPALVPFSIPVLIPCICSLIVLGIILKNT